jgi:hypothetical protein
MGTLEAGPGPKTEQEISGPETPPRPSAFWPGRLRQCGTPSSIRGGLPPTKGGASLSRERRRSYPADLGGASVTFQGVTADGVHDPKAGIHRLWKLTISEC